MNTDESNHLSQWRSLDNAGKLFPATSNLKDTRVFRLYCVLNEEVDEKMLQKALDITIQKFPVFLSVIRKGLFWHYLEQRDIKPVVTKESKTPCYDIYIRDKKSLLFDVSYFENKINFEVFHALTDGTGASIFIRELVKNYLYISHPEKTLPDVDFTAEDMTKRDQETDGFDKYFNKNHKIIKEKSIKMYQLQGTRYDYGEMGVNEYVFSTSQLLEKSRSYNVSLTVYLTAVLIMAINKERKARSRENVGIMVPVNLRKYFPADTMLNFFSWITPWYKCSEDFKLEDVIISVDEYFKRELDEDRVCSRMNEYVKIEKNPMLRWIPLELKILSMKLAANMATGDTTAIYSNIGRIKMPKEYDECIDRFGFFVSTPKLQICSCSYNDNFCAGFTTAYVENNIPRNFARILKEEGVDEKTVHTPYPEIAKKKHTTLFPKIIIFAMAIINVVCLGINYILTDNATWSLYVLLGSGCVLAVSLIGYHKRRNLLKDATWQLIIITSLCIVWDFVIGWKGWSLSFVLPVLDLVTLTFIIVISMAMKLKTSEYMIYLFMTLEVGLLPIVTIVTDTAWFSPVPSVICAGISVVLIVGLILFRWKDVSIESKKKFHL